MKSKKTEISIPNFTSLIMLIFFVSTICSNAQFMNPFGGENGEHWQQNSNQYIIWDTAMFTGNINVLIWNKDSSQYYTIASNVDYTLGQYTWSVPSDYPTGNNFRIKIVQSNDSTLYAFSPTFFPIYTSGTYYKKAIEEQRQPTEAQVPLIALFPNPAGDYIGIEISEYSGMIGAANYSILNILGQTVQSGTLEEAGDVQGECRISVESLPTGIYFLILKDSQAGTFVPLKFIKQ